MAGTLFGKIGFALLVVAWLLVIIALIVDVYAGDEDNDEDEYIVYGATEYRFDFGNGGDGDETYEDLCDDLPGSAGDDACDIQGRGVVILLCLIVTAITGLICVLGGIYYEFTVLALAPLFLKKIVGIASCAISCLCCLIGALAWWAGSPLFDDDDDDIVLGASWFMAFFAGLIYAFEIFIFAKVFDGPGPT